jgi:hypothetical protein
VKPAALEIEQTAETANITVRARAGCCLDQRLDPIDQGIASVDVDPGIGIGQAVGTGRRRLAHEALQSWLRLALPAALTAGASENKSRAGEVTGKCRALDLSAPDILTAHNERVPGTGLLHTLQCGGPYSEQGNRHMTLRRQIQFWLISLFAFCAFLYVFSGVLAAICGRRMPLPTCSIRCATGWKNWAWGVFGRRSPFCWRSSLAGLFFILLLPVLGNQLASFLDKLSGAGAPASGLVNEQMGSASCAKLPGSILQICRHHGRNGGAGRGVCRQTGAVVWSGGQALLSILSLFVITPVVAFYLLLDWDHMIAKIDGWLPRDHLEEIRGLAREMDGAVAGFVRGQLSVCLLLGAFMPSRWPLPG